VTELEQFVREGSEMMVKLPAMRLLETKMCDIRTWNHRLADVFHLLSPNDSLVPVYISCTFVLCDNNSDNNTGHCLCSF